MITGHDTGGMMLKPGDTGYRLRTDDQQVARNRHETEEQDI